MIKSFKLNIFIKLTALVFLIILVNRFIAQSFLVDQTENTILTEMSNDLNKCKVKLGDNHQFIHCAQEAPTIEIFNSIKAHYKLCPINALENVGHVCEAFNASSIQWVFSRVQDREPFTYGISFIDGVEWLAIKNTTHLKGDIILLERSWIKEYVKQVWALRDQNLLKALPVIILMMIGLALFMVYSAQMVASANSSKQSLKVKKRRRYASS